MPKARRAVAAIVLITSFAFAACGGGGDSGNPIPLPTPTPTPGTNPLAFTCPTSSTSFATVRSAPAVVRRSPVRTGTVSANPGLLVVSYDASRLTDPTRLDARGSSFGGRAVGSLHFAAVGRAARMIAVDPSKSDALAQALRGEPGVLAVQPSMRARALTVSGPYLTNDPYFRGQAGSTAPLYQTSITAGQWDMHVMGLGYAFAYSQPNNGSLRTNPNALGSKTVRLAVIDTGEDVTHPEVQGANVVYSHCYITNTSGVQSTGSFVTDPEGHGTDITGIAGADANNGFAFVGASGNISLMLYRVFPTPDDNCTSDATTDPQCGAADVDIASAIDDAVSNGANVINLSLGVGQGCTNGVDPDAVEGNAIANAIAHNVIVVAASGNSGTGVVGAPGCDPGVIAAGASAYNDGQANGTNYTGTHAEYVASYSQYGATNVTRSAASWGIVAPGGDPTGGTDPDNLHWIENIWTSTPFDANFAGFCGTDVFGETNDCRTLIAGTSMSTPHVAGAAALVLSVSGVGGPYDTPSAMKTLLCSTADDIGDPHQGCGRVNVYRVVATALNDPSLP